ncbi:MAG: 4Fe-4S binding protein [Deltaproteobacteria bacterium]|nr:4Fe-4S binding protein [Deltaproteobacteria bacterium]
MCWVVAPAAAQYRHDAAPTALDCETMPCTEVLPGATRFEPVEGAPFVQGFDATGAAVGWVVLSNTVVDVKAYSGKPLATVIGLTPDGVIAGARVIHHSEPVLLVGIPERKLHEFVAQYPGHRAIDTIVVGESSDPDDVSLDVISGATVTALAQNKTILDASRALGVAVGVIDASVVSPGHFINEPTAWSWARMIEEGVFGRLTVTQAQMEVPNPRGNFVDLWFTIADAPQVGRALLGDNDYAFEMGLLEPGQHLVVILGNGSSSYKGSAFVRGGIFDRVHMEQGFNDVVFRDLDYHNLGRLAAPDAPRFREGGVFITRGGPLDPGHPFELVFLGSRYNGQGGFTRDFHEFHAEHVMPTSVYVLDRPELSIWQQAWLNHRYGALALGLYLLFVVSVFIGRSWTTADPKRIKRLHTISMLIGVFGVGFAMKAQPSVTQLLTLVDSLLHEWRWELFASEPLIFLLWIFTFIASLIWGRGLFCGWVCPYGTMTDLLRLVAIKLHIPEFEFPERIHEKARFLRYFILLALIPIFLWDSVLGEKLAEIEPFKSTFLVPFWTRQWYLAGWWILLFVWSIFTFRPFCRYICPLGAGLAIFNSFRFSGPRRRNFCESCTICTRNCEPKAIRPDGTIDPRECLSCMDCEASYRNEQQCPPLIGIERLLTKQATAKLSTHDEERLLQLRDDAKPR